MNENKLDTIAILRKQGMCCCFCNKRFSGNIPESVEELAEGDDMRLVMAGGEKEEEDVAFFLCRDCAKKMFDWFQ